MVTNLPPDVKAKWAKASVTSNPREKLVLLREVLSGIPKHKGTERLVMALKRQIKNLQEEIEERKSIKRGKTVSAWTLRKEQDVLVAVLGRLTDCVQFHEWATGQKIGETQLFDQPLFGALKTSDIVIQYALLAVEPTFSETRLKKVSAAAVSSEILLILVSSPDDRLIDFIANFMEQRSLVLKLGFTDLLISYLTVGGVRLIGHSKHFTHEQLNDLLKSYGVMHAIVWVSESTTLEDVENMVLGRTFKPMSLVSVGSSVHSSIINLHGCEPEMLAKKIIEFLNKIIVYTKVPGGEKPSGSLLVNRGTKVKDFAQIIFHKPVQPSTWAKIQRPGDERALRVGSDFILRDGDVIEVHA